MMDLSPKIIVRCKTSEKRGAETNSPISVAFYDSKGKRSNDIEHVCGWRESFKPGSVKEIVADGFATDFGQLDKMEISMKTGSWFVEWVEVEDTFTKETSVFPVNRRVIAGKKLRLKLHDSVLPQDDEEGEQRRNELAEKKELYHFDWPEIKTKFEPAISKGYPPDEDFTPKYSKERHKREMMLAFYLTKARMFASNWKSFADMGNVYNGGFLPAPTATNYWKEDQQFAALRLNGVVPEHIRLCTELPDNFPVTNEMLQPIMENWTIEQAIAKKKLYIQSYELLKDLPCSLDENLKRVCTPLALFFVNEAGVLLPVAIQLQTTPGPNNPIFLPTDPPYTWMLAKMWFNTADAAWHQAVSHMGYTHMLIESVIVAAHRCLSPSHPIFRLMAPHMMSTIPSNRRGLPTTFGEDGYFDQVLQVGTVGIEELMRRRWKTWRLDVQGNLRNDLKERGVDDPEALPNYHWRDDILLLWDAIHKYVSTVVNGNYVSEEKLTGDTEIQEWAELLVAVDGCRIKGVPGGGKFQTCDQLIDTITSFIFQASAKHASINFSMYEQYGYPPNYTAYLHDLPPTDKRAVDEKYIFGILPQKSQTIDTMTIMKAVNLRSTLSLGDFEVQYTFDPIGTQALKTFRQELKAIGVTIDDRNAKRTRPYVFVHPQNVPNSVCN